jgi:hypothetical protein
VRGFWQVALNQGICFFSAKSLISRSNVRGFGRVDMKQGICFF